MAELKSCSKCKDSKTLSYYGKRSDGKGKGLGIYRSQCRDCERIYRSINGKGIKLKNRYNITITEYNDLYLRQKGKCAICDRKEVIRQGFENTKRFDFENTVSQYVALIKN